MINALERYISQEEDFEIVRKNPFSKHQQGQHDQKTHGFWASGLYFIDREKDNFNERTDGKKVKKEYADKYSTRVGSDGRNEPVGLSETQVESITYYTSNGFTDVNGYLRGTIESDNGFRQRKLERYVEGLDKLIEESPDGFGDKNLYRVFSKEVVNNLKEGDVLTDKGFVSTTRIDITSVDNEQVLSNLKGTTEEDSSNDVVALILPSASGKGKGLAVDYLKTSIKSMTSNIATAKQEKEVLLPRESSLKFLGYQDVSDYDLEVAVFQRVDK